MVTLKKPTAIFGQATAMVRQTSAGEHRDDSEVGRAKQDIAYNEGNEPPLPLSALLVPLEDHGHCGVNKQHANLERARRQRLTVPSLFHRRRDMAYQQLKNYQVLGET